MTKRPSVSNFNIADYEETHTFQLAFPATDNSLSRDDGQKVLFPPSVTISAVDRVLFPNEDTGLLEERVIAYRPGYSTIFVNEGEDLHSLIENRTRSLGDIEFQHGYLRVTNRQPQLLEYLRLCNKNGTNTNRDKNATVSFFEVNHDAAIKSILDNEERDLEIISFCTKGDYEEVRSVARSLGINVNQTVIQVRYDLRTMAMRNEETKTTFLRALKNPMVKRKSTCLEAVELEIIYINRPLNSLHWVKGGGNIITAPLGKDPIDYFVDNSFNNSYGESTYTEIEDQIEYMKTPKSELLKMQHDDIEINHDKADMDAFKQDPFGTIIRLGKVSGVLEARGAYVKYNQQNFRKSDFVDYLKQNPEIYEELKRKLLPKEALA